MHAQQIQFEDLSEAAGVFTAGGSHGVAVHDFNGDGFDDFFIAASRGQSVLFQNNGDLTFSDVTQQVGVDVSGDAVNPLWGDVNNDGLADLFVGTRGAKVANKLFLGDPAGGFVDVSDHSGMPVDISIGTAAFGDYDGDGWLDLFLATRDAPDKLLRNTAGGDSLFVDDSDLAGTSGFDFSIAMQATWQDYDLDGDVDLFAVHDGNLESRFYRQQAGFPRFVDVSNTAGIQVARSAMGVAWGDYNADGWPDAYVTNIAAGNLFHNNGDGTFLDVTEASGSQLNGMSWGVVFADFDNDGDEDLFIGNTFDFDGRRSFLYENRAGVFVDVAPQAGAALATNTFGVATGDFNNDGLPDLIVADEAGKNRLLINKTAIAGNWIQLSLTGLDENTMAIGTRVTLRRGAATVMQTVSGGDSFCSQKSNVLHLGLGGLNMVDTLVVQWSNNTVQRFTNLPVNQRYALTQGAVVNIGTDAPAGSERGAALLQNYPNPFLQHTTIRFRLKQTSVIALKVYDLTGREVHTLRSGVHAAGLHHVALDFSKLKAGIYFYKLITPREILHRTMVHLP